MRTIGTDQGFGIVVLEAAVALALMALVVLLVG